jgi:hypothetical protein
MGATPLKPKAWRADERRPHPELPDDLTRPVCDNIGDGLPAGAAVADKLTAPRVGHCSVDWKLYSAFLAVVPASS